ncbi:hypothetical protein PVK63_14520 [Aliivibrio sp. S2TY2]|uniref:hypothetical protein n=1 Tax=unclassified Aliivibrio TaxID=2645654 RepID=UPI002379613D|nr:MULTISPECIES: hypothetical protein [unclassified Aliivibrio]MDD9175925.1 hypothetical protein [Aliivibrio sp. S3TY1]MDD9193160.1 hypothetical protein [Aliivibrio sp. S2TY2]
MMLLLYIGVGMVGVLLSFMFSRLYIKNHNSLYLILYVVVSCIIFGSQHYSIFFDQRVMGYWFMRSFEGSFEVDGTVRFIAFVFLVLHALTIPFPKSRPQ